LLKLFLFGLYVDGFEGSLPFAILLFVIFELGLFGFGVGLLELDVLDGLKSLVVTFWDTGLL